MDQTITTISQLGGTVFTVVAFLWYISRYQDRQIESQIKLAIALENLTEKIVSNTSKGIENTSALIKNTETNNV